jgi:hypothetical protein
MRKLFWLILVFTSISSFSQPQGTKFIDPTVVTLDGESFVVLSDLKKIESGSAPSQFEIGTGALNIRVTGAIDRSTSTPVFISLFANEIPGSKLMIFSNRDSQMIQYQIEGSGSGSYAGDYSHNGYYRIKTRFKITAAGHPSYFLELSLNIYISYEGNISYHKSFMDGVASIYNTSRKKKYKGQFNLNSPDK